MSLSLELPNYSLDVELGKIDYSDIDDFKIAYYRDNPVAFVTQELKETPSPQQAKLLMDMADEDKLYHIICAGRGAGKTKVVSWIASWSAAVLAHFYPKYDISVLGGSKEQSQKLYNYVRHDVYKTPLLEKLLLHEPLKSYTEFINTEILTHAASSRSVRGSHVELLILDECAEINDDIFYDALPMITGSHHGRIIMLSTPHQFYGPFQDYWENAEDYTFTKHGPWPATECPWYDQRSLAMFKKAYTPQRYAVDILGQFPKLGDKMFEHEWIEQAIAKEPFKYNSNYDVDLGLDWGYFPSPTAIIEIQRYGGRIMVPGPEIVKLGEAWTRTIDWLDDYNHSHRLSEIHADAYGEGMNQSLRDMGINVNSVWFGNDKQLMQVNLQHMFFKNLIRISPDNTQLIEQLYKYRVEPIRRRLGKKDEDLVDALMLACKQFADKDLVERYGKNRYSMQFHLR